MAVMKDERLEKLSERDEIEALLPWYVSGKLDAKSRARVERYLEANPEVKAHLALAREEADASISANEAISPPGRDALDRLRGDVAAATPRQAMPDCSRNLRSLRRLACRVCATTARACRGRGSAPVCSRRSSEAHGALSFQHQTAGGEETTGGGLELLVGFSPEATVGEITDLLKSLDAVVTDGPRAGLYRLRFPEAKSGDEDRKTAIEALKQSGIVTSVLPES
jgi:hypothetical protein